MGEASCGILNDVATLRRIPIARFIGLDPNIAVFRLLSSAFTLQLQVHID